MRGSRLCRGFKWTLDRLYEGLEALLAILLRVMPVLLIVYFSVVFYALSQSSHWPFALRAQTRIVEVGLDGRAATRWDISSAAICLRDVLAETPPSYALIEDVDRTTRLCGSRRWHAYTPSVTGRYAPELAAKMGGHASASSGRALVGISSIQSGRVIVDIDTAPESDAAPTITVADGSEDLFEISAPVSFNWLTRETQRPLLFPFSGTIRVGKDVETSRRELLESGRISIFSPSQKDVGGRALVEAIDLLPGDMVDLSASATDSATDDKADAPAASPAFARGFVRFTADEMTASWPTMEVVAFGLSNRVRVHRYGEAGLDFQPGIWARLTHDNLVVIASLFLFGGLSILASLSEAMSLARRRS